jgi:hypothetical protein
VLTLRLEHNDDLANGSAEIESAAATAKLEGRWRRPALLAVTILNFR